MSTLSTHILDISTGKPAVGVNVHLEREGQQVASKVTDSNGRVGEFTADALTAGRYCLVAEIGEWFASNGRETLYVRAQIDVVIATTADEHFHLPFLIAPGGWSTYRGS